MSSSARKAGRAARDNDDDDKWARMLRGVTLSHRDWLGFNEQRQRMRRKWRDFFAEYDLLPCPVNCTGGDLGQDQRAAPSAAVPVRPSVMVPKTGESCSSASPQRTNAPATGKAADTENPATHMLAVHAHASAQDA